MNNSLRVMIAEDEPLVSMLLEEMLLDLGATVASVATNFPDALAAADDGNFDCALLDMNLHGERADPVAARLTSRGIPFAILSGGQIEATKLGAVLFVPKPYRFEDIERALNAINQEIEQDIRRVNL